MIRISIQASDTIIDEIVEWTHASNKDSCSEVYSHHNGSYFTVYYDEMLHASDLIAFKLRWGDYIYRETRFRPGALE